jgi:ABC-type antimicrobial peptide transport system permease subunit
VFLAAIGIWSVVAHAVAQRTRELGIRIALGARADEVVALAARSGAAAAAVGVLLGLACASATSRVLASLLYGVTPNDPIVLLIALVVFTGIGGLASALPALRATRVDPVQAMRVD